MGTDRSIGKVVHGALAYDIQAWVLTLGNERRFRERLVRLARLAAGESVLDVGCGTGALTIAAHGQVGSAGEVCGVDPSPEMVARARRKAAKAGVDVRFEVAAAQALPFPDARFDVVLSCLVLHHVSEGGRPQAIGEIRRVLRPGGRFLAIDFGGGGKRTRHGMLHRLHRMLHRLPGHNDFDLDELTPALESEALDAVERGPVDSSGVLGHSNLRFLLARALSP
ncbi:MAG: class I SAM-dependent methyltransferase [Acidimicrobiales bacterium]